MTTGVLASDIEVKSSGPPVLRMSEEEYTTFLQEREKLAQDFANFRGESRISSGAGRKDLQPNPFLTISLPGRDEQFISRSLEFHLKKEDWRKMLGGLRFFPETRTLFYRWSDDASINMHFAPRPFESHLFPLDALRAVNDLPLLESLVTHGGNFSDEAMEAIATHPSLRSIQLGRCYITPQSFSRLEKLKTLDSLGVISGASPEWFVTLAKLPRFRVFAIYGANFSDSRDLNQPITDTTRRAIESMDGRLEEFWAETIGTMIHADVFRALLNVKSLKVLRVDTVGPGLTLDDLRVLKEMPNLTELGYPRGGTYFAPAIRDEANALILEANQRADARRLREKSGPVE